MFPKMQPLLRNSTHPNAAVVGFIFLGFFIILIFMQPIPAFGQEVRKIFIAPAAELTIGRPASFWLYCINDSHDQATNTFLPRFECKIHYSDGETQNSTVSLKPGQQTQVNIAQQAFAKAEYELDSNFIKSGRVTIEFPEYNEITFEVKEREEHSGPLETPNDSLVERRNAGGEHHTDETTMFGFFTNHLSLYEPIYFLIGTYPAVEFQYSLKYQLFTAPRTNDWRWLNGLFFGFTQTSYWDLLSKDPSFYDTSYKPSLFYYKPNLTPNQPNLDVGLQIGAEHESNGKGGLEERSAYTAYLQPSLNYDLTPNWTFTVKPRAWYYLALGNNNSDLASYRGYGELYTALTWHDKTSIWQAVQLSSRLRVGDEGWHPGLWVDLRFYLPKIGVHLNPSVQVEYFTGYGQTFRQYNQYSHGLRAGFCLWY
jgi:outer membrane phospholipase A